jgi:hypothetical protein
MTLALADQSSMPPLAGWQMVVAVILGLVVRAAGAWWVCEACGDLWPRADVRPYDQEASA